MKEIKKAFIEPETFKKSFLFSPDVAAILDSKGKFIEVNQLFLDLLGVSRIEVIGKKYGKVVKMASFPAAKKIFRKIKKRGFVRDEEVTLQSKSGKWLALSVFAKMLPDKNIIVYARDSMPVKKLQEMIQSINEFAHDVEIYRDEQNKVVYVSPSFKQFTGYSPKDYALGKIKIENLFHPEDLDRAKLMYREIFDKKSIKDFELRVVKKNKEIIYVSVSSQPIVVRGEYRGARTKIIDISERKRTEEIVKRNMTFLQNLIDVIDQPIYIKGKTGVYSWCNRAFLEFFNNKKEEVIGKTAWDIFPKELAKMCEKSDKETIRENQTVKEEIFFNLKKKNYWIQMSKAAFYDSLGNYEGIITIINNITDIKNKEKETTETKNFLDTIVENIPNMIFVKDAKSLKFKLINKRGEFYFGKDSEEIIGKNDFNFFPKKQAEYFVKKDRKVLREKKLLDIPREYINTPQGTRILRTKKIPLSDSSGVPKYLLGVSEDITEVTKAEDEAKKYAQELEKFNKFAIGRELKMVELKKEINELMREMGKSPRYEI